MIKSYRHIGLLLAVLCSGFWAFGYQSTKAERNLIKEGNQQYAAGNYARALEDYTKALEAAPGSEYAMFNIASAMASLSENAEDSLYKNAVTIYDNLGQAASNATIREKANYNMGNLAFHQQNYPQSIEYYKETLRINPNNLKARENLRVAQLKLPPPEENQDQQDQQDQQQEQQDQQQEQQQEQQQQEQQQPQQEREMSSNAEQILQTMQNRENQTRENVKEDQPNSAVRTTDKPW